MGKSIEDMMAGDEKRKPGRKDLTTSEIAERDEEIVADRLRGRSWQWVADKHEVTRRTAQERFEIWREQNKHRFEGVDAISIVHEMLDTYAAVAEEAAEIAADAEQDNNKLGALNAQMSAMRQEAELMQATGILPKNLGVLKWEIDARVLGQRLVRVLHEHHASPELKQALLGALEGGANGEGDVPVAGLPGASD